MAQKRKSFYGRVSAANKKRKVTRRKYSSRPASTQRRRGFRMRMGGRRKVPKVRISAPNMQVATTFYSNKLTTKMKMSLKRFKGTKENHYVETASGQITSGSGVQSYAQFTLMDAGQMRNALNTVGMSPGSTSGTQTDTNQIFWKSSGAETVFTNSANTTAFVDMYHMVSRRDTVSTPYTCWKEGLKDENGGLLTDPTNVYGMSPTISQTFNTYYKMKKVYSIVLMPGQSVQHRWYNHTCKSISNELLATDVNTSVFLAGITQAMLVVVRGQAATDTANSTLTNSAPVKVDFITTRRFKFTYLSDNDVNLRITQGIGAAAGAAISVVNTIGAATVPITGTVV